MCKNDGTPAAMELGESDTAVAALVRNILGSGDEVGDTSQKEYTTGCKGPHTLHHPNTSARIPILGSAGKNNIGTQRERLTEWCSRFQS